MYRKSLATFFERGDENVKKLAASLLAACLALSPCAVPGIQVFGAAKTHAAAAQTKTVQAESALEVRVVSSSFFPYDGGVTVKVQGAGQSLDETLTLADAAQSAARFPLTAGKYTVTIASKKFADYTQEVQVQSGWTHKITVCPTKIKAAGGGTCGWIRPGDVNGDGTIDQEDKEALLKAVHSGLTDETYDLNSDGSVDIADMKFLAESLDERQNSSVEKLWIAKGAVQTAGKITSGSLEGLLWEGKPMIAGPQKEGAVSADNPIAFEFTLSDSDQADQIPKIQAIVIDAPFEKEDGQFASQIADGTADVDYVDEYGARQTMQIPLSGAGRRAVAALSMKAKSASLREESNGSLILDLGGQIAVKRVTIRITGTTKKEQPLIEIAKVEFVNNMAERIPEPELDIPSITSVAPGNKMLTVSWKPQVNITGYEVQITGPVKDQSELQTQIFRASDSVFAISSINDQKMLNYETYRIRVRSVNGGWKSPWSAESTGIPAPQEKPAPPDNVTAQGGPKSILVSWKDMDDADGYMVYYKQTSDRNADFKPVVEGFTQKADGTGKLEENKYTITGLLDLEEYSVYVVGWNDLGWGKASLTASAVTKVMAPPILPKYKLLNTSNGAGKLTAHIVSAAYGGSGGASMVASPLDTAKNSALGLVDDDFASYWYKSDWDDGISYNRPDGGMSVTLDDDYRMNYFTFGAEDQKSNIGGVKIQYWHSSDASAAKSVGARLILKKDSNDNPYYIVKLDETITANKIHMWLGNTAGNVRDLRVGEIHFHRYDSLEDEIMGMYTDVMHTTLRPDVNESVIQGLERRLELTDADSGEKHPMYQELALELKTAREILNGNLDPAVVLSSQITAAKDKHLGFTGLNAWQPLGKTAYAGETLLVYVGHNTKRTGDAAQVQLVFTQHHAEAANVSRAQNLRIGRNEITVPQLASTAAERGGQLYAAYTGNNAADQYAVRIAGGSNIPVLNVYGKSGAQRTQALQAYVTELESYVGTIKAGHESKHAGTKNVNYEYGDGKNCILDATDLLLGQMMYSLPATQVLAGLGSAADKAAKLDNALKAMEDTMTLFYHHKGLSSDAGTARGNNALPSQHLNIRYMRMFAGAFMYAAGNHIGIEWGSAPLASGPNDMSGFGWGIAHEIGHDINQGAYAVAEVTNNYFSMLLTGKKRYTDTNVYKKVTSGTTGRASNVFTQLALYWQLHLAYDNNADDHYIYGTYEDQFNNLFFARVDTYARNPQSAPQAGLTLDGSADQNLMRLACAAANKNILPFFVRWGMEPDAATTAYAQKYGAEEAKALYYAHEDARAYRLAHPDEAGNVLQKDAATASVQKTEANGNKVKVSITRNSQVAPDAILGYEIIRTMYKDGKKQEPKVVGFQPYTGDTTEYTDLVSTINNRVMYYQVKAVDKYLNYSNPADAGFVKINTDGRLGKDNWTVETTMVSDQDQKVHTDDDPDGGYDEKNPGAADQASLHTIDRIIDNEIIDTADPEKDTDTVFHESAANPPAEATITIDMHQVESVTMLKYQGDALQSATVDVSTDGTNWKTVKKGFAGLGGSGTNELWFDALTADGSIQENFVGTYDARYVRLTIAKSGSISIREIDLCGPSGDNIEFQKKADGTIPVGRLTKNWQYGQDAADVVTTGALIFTGTYKGNPAYNVVIVYDEQGNVIGSSTGSGVEAASVILAQNPGNGNLGNTSDGTWIYFVQPKEGVDFNSYIGKNVRAELYRVDDALTLGGERLVSDTAVFTISSIDDMEITGNTVPSLPGAVSD